MVKEVIIKPMSSAHKNDKLIIKKLKKGLFVTAVIDGAGNEFLIDWSLLK